MKSSHKTNKSRAPKAVLIALAVVLILGVGVTGAVALKLQSLTKGSVAIATRPSEPTSSAVPTTSATETQLPTIDGTPADIDVDYDVDVIDPANEPIYQVVPIDANTINIILLSSDARPGEKGGRSDSMMLMSYNRKMGAIKLTSFMRDSWVRIEGHGWNRINAAYSFGGIGLAVNTVNENFDLDVQNYVTIRFEQFISIVDQMGGVSLKLSKAEIDYINRANPSTPMDPVAGVKLLNGAQTLTHCRNRSVGNGDFDRTRRQRDTMVAILQKMKQQRDPVKITKLLTVALDQITTNMKANEIFTLVREALGNSKLSFDEARVPFDKTWHYANEGGRSVIAIDLVKNKTLLNQFLYG